MNAVRTVVLDLETYSDADLKVVGGWCYAAHPSTEIVCLAWAVDDGSVDDGPVQLWTPGEDDIELRTVLADENNLFVAHNSSFEIAVLTHCSPWTPPPAARWRDTAAMAAAMGLPRHLAGATAMLGFPEDRQKDKRGKELIKKLSMPQKDGSRNRDPELLAEFHEYCKQDVIAERELYRVLAPLTDAEQATWEIDFAINRRGIPIDRESAVNAVTIYQVGRKRDLARLKAITTLDNPNSRDQFHGWLKENGVDVPNVQKATLGAVARDTSPEVAEAITLRLSLARTPVTKYANILERTTADGRFPGAFLYHGAATGRWASRGVNVQNLPRPSIADTDSCIDLFRYRDHELIEMLYDDTVDALASCIRGVICARPGHRLIAADFNAIEARVLAWLAGQADVLDVFRGDGKIYEYTASQIYGKRVDAITADERFIGKVSVLALGYRGGAQAFANMAKNYGVDIDPDLAEQVKTDWRRKNDKIVAFWGHCEDAAKLAIEHPGQPCRVGRLKFVVEDRWLFIQLPSKRRIAYYKPTLVPADRGHRGDQIQYLGSHSQTGAYSVLRTYGGRIVENVTQAVARDILAEAMLRLDAAGYPIVLHVHDEIVAEVPESPEGTGNGSVAEFERIMCELPVWAKGLPVRAEGYEAKRYRK